MATAMKANEAFTGLTNAKSVGYCFACRKVVERGDRVHVRAVAQAHHPETGRKTQGLASSGHTFCPECARKTFDDLKQRLEAGR